MAQEKDVTRRPKFFTRKKTCDVTKLCERCQHHQHIILVRFGCDIMMFTDTNLRTIPQFGNAARNGQFIHLWCLNEDDPPACIEQFREAKAVQ